MPAPSIFLSHNVSDKPFARRIGQALTSAGATVWIDEGEIKLGDSLIRKISEGLDACDYLGVILSPESVASEWVRREVEIVLNREIAGKRVIVLPLLYRNCAIPAFLSDKLYADFTDPSRFSEPLNVVLDRLGLALSPTELSQERVAEDLLHQLRGPMTVARHQLRFLSTQEGIPLNLQKDLQNLTTLLNRAETVISTFRLLRIYAHGNYPLNVQSEVPIADVLTEAAQQLRLRLNPRRELQVSIELQRRPRVSCDPRLIEIAIGALLDNAFKYSYSGTSIRVSCNEDRDNVSIAIVSTGIPIPEDDISMIFQKGYRGRHTPDYAAEGNGTGLYLAQQIMMSHGGEARYRDLGEHQKHEFSLNWPKRYSPEVA